MKVRLGVPAGVRAHRRRPRPARGRSGGEPVVVPPARTRPSTGAAAVHTDVWASMGQEGEADARRRAFEGFRSTTGSWPPPRPTPCSCTACRPTGARRWRRASSTVPQSVVFAQAHNRLHSVRGLLSWLIEEAEHDRCARDRRRPPRRAEPTATAPASARSARPSASTASPACSSRARRDQPGPARRPARRRGRGGHPGHRVARPRGPRRHQGAGAAAARRSTPSPSCRRSSAPPRTTCAGCSATGWSRWPSRPTWSCCARRPGRPTWWPRRSTGRRCPASLGTVAGDDTLIVVVADGTDAAGVAASSPTWPASDAGPPTDVRRPRPAPEPRERRGSRHGRSESSSPTAVASTRRWPSAG